MKYFILVALIVFTPSFGVAGEPQPAKGTKAKTDAAAKAEATAKAKAQQAAEDRADDEQEKDRWDISR